MVGRGDEPNRLENTCNDIEKWKRKAQIYLLSRGWCLVGSGGLPDSDSNFLNVEDLVVTVFAERSTSWFQMLSWWFIEKRYDAVLLDRGSHEMKF
jgi:hypothetical protein